MRQPAQAVLCDDPDEVAEIYQRLIEDMGTDRAARRLGLRFNVDRAPTRDELKEGIRRSGLSIVRVYPHPQPVQKPDKWWLRVWSEFNALVAHCYQGVAQVGFV